MTFKLPALTLSKPLLAWLREDPHWPRLDWRLRAALAWRAHWGSVNARLSEAQARPAASTQDLAPLLILGPWRSGTTVMHELLTAATAWPTPLTWQCMDACAFRLGHPPRSGVRIARPMDGLTVDALSPQEDEFALLTLGQPSAYRAFWQPQRILELLPTLEQEFWLEHGEWLAPWESFLRAVQASAPSAGGLILKSPNHSFRLQAILRRFPAAKVVWMLRDPADVFQSNLKMWRTMFREHGLGPSQDEALEQFLVAALQASAASLRWALAELPAGQLVCCSQEQLRQAPAEHVERILDALGLRDQADGVALRSAIKRTQVGRTEVYSEPLPAAARAAVEALRAAQAEAQPAS
ncbi:sulfotransferase [Pelomonas sp. SE-A7]|uniref:sulfotransferase family protein n=1 Tax=Pelomonas sp. SE-A7 TaxID=3054953 RepID=UPI00259C7F08|nr:sulfotransferase [Pelomonas sp. SE-A7]MDM4767536.1 sulfotransferase [Pelomonas sp. SE-A7]